MELFTPQVFLRNIIRGNKITIMYDSLESYPDVNTTYYCIYLSNNDIYIFEICTCVDYSNCKLTYTTITKQIFEDLETFIEYNTNQYFIEGYYIYYFPENLYRISNYNNFETIDEGYIKIINKYNNKYNKIITWTQNCINPEFNVSNECNDDYNINIDFMFHQIENYNLLHYLQRYYHTIITDHISDIIKIYL